MSTPTPNTTPMSTDPTIPTMSTDPTRRDDATTDPDGASPQRQHLLDPAEDRGRTTIADRVIEAMAARIVSEQPGVGGAARQVLGVAVTPEDAQRAPQVQATVAGEVVALRVRLSVIYPAPVHTMTDQVRRRLIDRIGAFTGKRVGVVDIVVTALHRPDVRGRIVR